MSDLHLWRVLPQISFLSRQKFCFDKHVFDATKHVFCCDKSMLAATKRLSRQNFVCSDKRQIFVATKDVFCRDKQTCVCRDKIMFVATNVVAGPANDGFQLQCTYLGAKGAEQVACVLGLFGAERCILRDFVFSLFLSFTYSRELISQSVLSDCRGRNFRVGIFVWQSRSEVRNRFINL